MIHRAVVGMFGIMIDRYCAAVAGAFLDRGNPDSKVHGANMGPTWDLSARGGAHVGPMNLAIRQGMKKMTMENLQIA